MSTSAINRVSIKGLKHSEFASRETYCFEASVYIDGKRAGTVSNEGTGGANSYAPRTIEKLVEAIAETLPPISLSQHNQAPLKQTAETLIFTLVEDELNRRKIASLTKSKTYFRKPGESYATGQWSVIPGKADEARIRALQEKYGPGVLILGHNHQQLN